MPLPSDRLNGVGDETEAGLLRLNDYFLDPKAKSGKMRRFRSGGHVDKPDRTRYRTKRFSIALFLSNVIGQPLRAEISGDDMPTIAVEDRSGNVRTLQAREELSVMEIIREGGNDELLALCGGCCSCATCHIYVEEGFVANLPLMSADENDLLDSSSFRTAQSRLACQIPFSSKLDGVMIKIAPED